MEIELDDHNGIIVVDANNLDPEAVGEFVADLAATCASLDYPILIDRSAPSTGAIAWSAIQQGSRRPEGLQFLRGRRVAGVVPSGMRYAVARQIAAVASALEIAEYQPFTRRCEAIAWLVGSEGAPF